MRRWFAKLWVVLFALSYSAAALAAHCHAHFAQAPQMAFHDEHEHGAASAAHPNDQNDECAAMAWDDMLVPAPVVLAPPAPIPEIKGMAAVTLYVWLRAGPYQVQIRPPPNPESRSYTANFARTGRLLI